MSDFLDIGFIGLLFLIVVGIGLYYLTGDNKPYRKRRNLIVRGSRKPIPIRSVTQIEADYKVVEISREPLEGPKEPD